jgi:hypothetical protein
MTIEQRIKEVASDFSTRAQNYRVEEELRSKLAECLRKEFKRTPSNDELVRVQFPIRNHPHRHYDVVILTEGFAEDYAIGYGDKVSDCLDNFNSTAIFELKQEGRITEEADKIDSDINRLTKAITQRRTENAYLLIFIHSEIDRDETDEILNKYISATKVTNKLSIYCFFRGCNNGICVNSGRTKLIPI